MLYIFLNKLIILLIILLLVTNLINVKYNIIFLFIIFELLLLLLGVFFTIATITVKSLFGIFLFIFILSLSAIKAAIGMSLIINYIKKIGTIKI